MWKIRVGIKDTESHKLKTNKVALNNNHPLSLRAKVSTLYTDVVSSSLSLPLSPLPHTQWRRSYKTDVTQTVQMLMVWHCYTRQAATSTLWNLSLSLLLHVPSDLTHIHTTHAHTHTRTHTYTYTHTRTCTHTHTHTRTHTHTHTHIHTHSAVSTTLWSWLRCF